MKKTNNIETIMLLCDIIEQMAALIEKQQILIAQSDIDSEVQNKIAKKSAELREKYIRA